MISRPIGRYFGGKWRLSRRLIELSKTIACKTYCEPFGGFYSHGLARSASEVEVYNDLHRGNQTLFQQLRDNGPELIAAIAATPIDQAEFNRCKFWNASSLEPLEVARRYLLYSQLCRSGGGTRWSSGTSSQRLAAVQKQSWDYLAQVGNRIQNLQILGMDAIACLERFDSPQTFFYVDPPYPHWTRGSKDRRHRNQAESAPRRQYQFEYGREQHVRLLEILASIQGSFMISSYANDLYDQALEECDRIEINSIDGAGSERVEVVWVRVLDRKQLCLF